MDPYTLYVDKPTLFECKIELDGASLHETTARLVIEGKSHHLMFVGSVDKTGKCSIPVSKLKGILDENSTGTMTLEIIAEDTFFEPWSSEFTVEAAKKVTVEVKNHSVPSKPALRVEVATPIIDPLEKATRAIVEDLRNKGITVDSAIRNKTAVRTVIQEHLNKINKGNETNSIIPRVVKLLAK
jgi:hypothetical protein